MLDNKLDSALYLLRKINMVNLSEKDQAEYALFYTTAQDKSGLDVDNDSLIRLAYEWYVKHPEDSLYAKCLYYMGKYYMLNDSTEQSVHCFKESYIRAFKQKDMKNGSLALEKLSKVVRDVNPKEAVKYSRKAVLSYNKCRQAKLANKIYLRLNYDEALSFVGHTRKAIEDIRLLLMDAFSLGDSTVLPDVYQDLANFYLDQSLQDCSNFWGDLYVDAEGTILLSAGKILGNIKNWDKIPFESLLKENSLWRKVRGFETNCQKCLFRNICPPISLTDIINNVKFCNSKIYENQ